MYAPNFRISNNLLKYISNIEACREVVRNAPLVPAWEARFREEAAIRSVHHGTHLEGNELTKEQTERLMRLPMDGESSELLGEKAGITAQNHDIQEVLNYREVLEWIDQQEPLDSRQKPLQYDADVLKLLHSFVVKNIIPDAQAGAYRTQQVVVRSVDTGDVAFRPPLAIDVPQQVEEFFAWLNGREARDMHPVIRAGVTHYELVRIHPFVEGNGRTARAFATFVLFSEGYDIKKFFSMEEYFDRDIEGYYKALLSVQKTENQDLTYWLEYFSYGLAIELDRIKNQVLKLSQDIRLKSKLGKQVALSERQIILLEILQNQGQLTSAEANSALPMVSTDTILRDLKDLIEKGIIKKQGVTKGVTYLFVE